jgi:non-homologous end joining protein Ku
VVVAPVIDLMEALKASVAAAKKSAPPDVEKPAARAKSKTRTRAR